MALTKHELLHLNAVIKSAKEEGNTKALEDAEEILRNGIFPDLDKTCLIHDFLEEDSEGNKWQTQ